MPEERERLIDTHVDALFQSLPATTLEDIRLKMQRTLGSRISIHVVYHTLQHLRKHCREYGWTVPPVKRGSPIEGDEGRFFHLLMTPDGRFEFDQEHRHHLDRGRKAQIQTIEQQSKNLETALGCAISVEPNRLRRDMLDEMRENVAFVARRAERMRKKMAA